MAGIARESDAAAVGYPEWDRSREPGEGYYSGRRDHTPRPVRRQDEEEDESTDYAGAFIATACWYVVPLIGYVIWAATLSSDEAPHAVRHNAAITATATTRNWLTMEASLKGVWPVRRRPARDRLRA